MQLFVTDEQLTEAGKPRVGDFDDPAARTLSGGTLLVFDAAWAHMRRVVAIEHFLMRGTADKAGVGAQVLAPPRPTGGRGTAMASRVAASSLTSFRFAAVTMIDSGTPRASTNSILLLPFFPPVGGVGPDRLASHRCLQ